MLWGQCDLFEYHGNYSKNRKFISMVQGWARLDNIDAIVDINKDNATNSFSLEKR